ncbi:uncharacterized protein [Macaca fascicularis]|uniref:uncharacterized protein n=1 Tax=Macaca fascicularis TaxID=9541 RepID=UPI003D154C10
MRSPRPSPVTQARKGWESGGRRGPRASRSSAPRSTPKAAPGRVREAPETQEPGPGVPAHLSHRRKGWGRLQGRSCREPLGPQSRVPATTLGPGGEAAATCRGHLQHRSHCSGPSRTGQDVPPGLRTGTRAEGTGAPAAKTQRAFPERQSRASATDCRTPALAHPPLQTAQLRRKEPAGGRAGGAAPTHRPRWLSAAAARSRRGSRRSLMLRRGTRAPPAPPASAARGRARPRGARWEM